MTNRYRRAAVFAAALSAPFTAYAQHQGHSDTAPPVDHRQMDHSQMDHGAKEHEMNKDEPSSGSGTSRLPANENMHTGAHFSSGKWDFMAHGYLWGVYSDQGGPRGDTKAFVN